MSLYRIHSWSQNVAELTRKSYIEKVFELAELRFSRDMERNFRIGVIFLYRDRNRILIP